MVQHALDQLIGNAHLAKTGSKHPSQIMSADIENAIIAGYAGYSPRCRAFSDWLAVHW
jgi:hypothetical protein